MAVAVINTISNKRYFALERSLPLTTLTSIIFHAVVGSASRARSRSRYPPMKQTRTADLWAGRTAQCCRTTSNPVVSRNKWLRMGSCWPRMAAFTLPTTANANRTSCTAWSITPRQVHRRPPSSRRSCAAMTQVTAGCTSSFGLVTWRLLCAWHSRCSCTSHFPASRTAATTTSSPT